MSLQRPPYLPQYWERWCAAQEKLSMGMKAFELGTATITEAKRPAVDLPPPGKWTLTITGWTPTPLNKLLGCHHMQAHKLKKRDYEVVAVSSFGQCIPGATRKRRVSVRVSVPNTSRAADPDGYLKVLLDSLVTAGLLVDDSAAWCEFGAVEVCKGKKATVIELEDIA